MEFKFEVLGVGVFDMVFADSGDIAFLATTQLAILPLPFPETEVSLP